MCQFLRERLNDAIRQGFSGFRATGEMSWAESQTGIYEKLLEYETKMEDFYPGTQSIGMSQYPRHLLPTDRLLKIARHHRLASLDGLVTENHCIRIRQQDFFADVLTDKHRILFHYVVQQDGSAYIRGWGQEPTFSGAVASGEFTVAQLSEQAKRRARKMKGQRRYNRHPLIVPVEVTLPDGTVLHAESANISEGGMAAKLPLGPRQHEVMNLSFSLPGGAERIISKAKLAWVGADSRAGFSFLRLSQHNQVVLNDWLLTHQHPAQP